LESENGKMSSSFIHVDMDEKLVQDKDSIENINTECKTNVENGVSHNTGTVNIPKTNVENGVSHNIGTVNIPNGIRHSNSKDEIKVKHEIEEEASCQQEDYKYVVPKIPVSKGKGDNKLANLGKTSEDHKKEGKKQRKPEKSTTVKKEKVISKEKDSLQKEKVISKEKDSLQKDKVISKERDSLQKEKVISKEKDSLQKEKVISKEKDSLQKEKVISKEKDSLQKEKEPSTNTVGSKDEKIESCGNKEAPDTNAYPIQTVGKEKTTEQDGVKQKYVIPSKKNKDSAASSEKQEEYTTEPKNFVEFVERKTARRMMVDAKMLMYELGFLKDVKQTEIECAVIGQYEIAAKKKVKSLFKKLNLYIKMLHVFHKYCRN
jgi:hypothetical protein